MSLTVSPQGLSDLHIQEFANFDYLLTEELYQLRRSFGFDWFGRIEITNLEQKHFMEREKMNIALIFKHKSTEILSNILYNYVKIHPTDRAWEFDKIYKNKHNNLTDDELIEYNILKKFNQYRYKDTANLERIHGVDHHKNNLELENYRKYLQKYNIPKPFINYSDVDMCSICMDTDKQIDCITNCKHQFHKSCIEFWLGQKNSCPVCRCNTPQICEVDICKISSV